MKNHLDGYFVKRNLDEEKEKVDSFTVRLNFQERTDLEEDKQAIHQEKDSTAMKQVWQIGRKVLHSDLQQEILGTLFKNKKKNKRLGIVDFE
jgi:hypothetical protein